MSDTRPEPRAARGWSVVTGLIFAGVFMQSVFAGFLLSGDGWGRSAHSLTATLLIAGTLIASIVAAITLRRSSERGGRFAASLFALAIVLVIQTAVGHRSADGENLLWLHVPLGVALVVLTILPVRMAWQLRHETSQPVPARGDQQWHGRNLKQQEER